MSEISNICYDLILLPLEKPREIRIRAKKRTKAEDNFMVTGRSKEKQSFFKCRSGGGHKCVDRVARLSKFWLNLLLKPAGLIPSFRLTLTL